MAHIYDLCKGKNICEGGDSNFIQPNFAGNARLMGKRVNFSARTVISSDPNLRIDQVGL